MGLFARFLGRTASEGAAFAMGAAVAPALTPAVRELVNEAWQLYPTRPLDPALLAEAVSTRQLPHDWASNEAANSGIAGGRFDNMVKAFDTGPGVARAFDLWRRTIIDEAGFRKALGREGLEAEWIDDLVAARNVLLSPADLAAARQRGFVDAARQRDESNRQGITDERADLLFELSGLPPGPERAMVMWRRGIITEAEFKQTIVEGNEKLKYTDEEAALFHELEPLSTLVNLRLRGWIDDGEFHTRALKHGFTTDVADDLFHAIGRPATTRQVMIGLRRGGVYGAPLSDTPQPFRDAIIRSDIRPEWANLLYEGRETYPSAFVVRRLVEEGTLTADEGHDVLYKAGLPDDLARKAANSWAAGSGTTSKGLTATDLAAEYEGLFITRAQYVSQLQSLGYTQAQATGKADATDAKRARTSRNQVIGTVRTAYVRHRIGRDRAVSELAGLGLPQRLQTSYMADFDRERALTPDAMTPAQIKKAFQQVRMTRDEAIGRLEFKGYDAADANIYLDE